MLIRIMKVSIVLPGGLGSFIKYLDDPWGEAPLSSICRRSNCPGLWIFWRYCAADVQISQIPFYPQMGLGQHSLQAIATAGRIYGYSLIWATLVRFS
jgi:hypothetical protein